MPSSRSTLFVARAHIVQGFTLAVPLAESAKAGTDKPSQKAAARRARANIPVAAVRRCRGADFPNFAADITAAPPILCIAI
jgi:hypothetical protein